MWSEYNLRGSRIGHGKGNVETKARSFQKVWFWHFFFKSFRLYYIYLRDVFISMFKYHVSNVVYVYVYTSVRRRRHGVIVGVRRLKLKLTYFDRTIDVYDRKVNNRFNYEKKNKLSNLFVILCKIFIRYFALDY